MGAILAVLGEAGDPELPLLLQRMTDRSPYCGAVEQRVEGGLAVAVQTLGWDASLAVDEHRLVAFHGYPGRWERQARDRGLDFDPAWSEAEKLALAHRRLGDALFPLLRGEFALLIHDLRRQRLLALRDVVGCRPLFFEQQGGRTFLATETGQVLTSSGSAPRPNHDALVDYLLNRPLAREETLQLPVRRVLPGRVYSFDSSEPAAPPECTDYWAPPEVRQTACRREDAVDELRALLQDSLDAALPQRPFALALSGGVDSPTLWAMLARRAAAGDRRAARGAPFSLVYPGMDCDERDLIEQVLERTGTGNDAAAAGRFIDATACRPLEAYPGLVALTQSVFPPALHQFGQLFEAAGREGRHVILTGLGPDDWLRGNLGYIPDLLFRGRPFRAVNDAFSFQLPWGASRAGFLRQLLGQAGRRVFPRLRRGARPAWLAEAAWQQALSGTSRHPWERFRIPLARRALLRDLERYRSGVFLEPAARFAASAGMELRHPLLGVDYVEFALRTPARLFTGGRRYKDLLRLAAGDLLPEPVREKERRVVFNSLFLSAANEIARKGKCSGFESVSCGMLRAKALHKFLSGLVHEKPRGSSFLQMMRFQIVEIFLQQYLMKTTELRDKSG